MYGNDAYNLPQSSPVLPTAYGLPDYAQPAEAAASLADGEQANGSAQQPHEDAGAMSDAGSYSDHDEAEPVVAWTGEMLIKMEVSGMFGARRTWKLLPCYLYEGELSTACLMTSRF